MSRRPRSFFSVVRFCKLCRIPNSRLVRRGLSTTDSTQVSSSQSSQSESNTQQNLGDNPPKLATGSAKLFEDSASDDVEAAAQAQVRVNARIASLNAKEENWKGEENVRDAVLRMLVDKYKPLRGPAIQSADTKLHNNPPTIAPSIRSMQISPSLSSAGSQTSFEYKPDWKNRASEPLIPAIEGHRPWHTTYVAPAPIASRIRAGTFEKPQHGSSLARDKQKAEITAQRRSANAQRLGRARESTLDYRLGVRKAAERYVQSDSERKPAMIAVGGRGWASLVEEKIERARLQGQFKALKGRGRPLEQTVEERNPFIAREEFLMNRIVQRNEAAPAWIELQRELESSVSSFRATLLSSWTRCAIRLLTIPSGPGAHLRLQALTLDDARALRDRDWEKREEAYHDAAIIELNETIRRYNGVAPYAVRRTYYTRVKELDKAYMDGGQAILEGVRERLTNINGRPYNLQVEAGDREDKRGSPFAAETGQGILIGFWHSVRSLLNISINGLRRLTKV